jgi:hypothetical protein
MLEQRRAGGIVGIDQTVIDGPAPRPRAQRSRQMRIAVVRGQEIIRGAPMLPSGSASTSLCLSKT